MWASCPTGRVRGVSTLDGAAETVIRHTMQSPAAQRAAIRLAKDLGEGLEEFVSKFADAYFYRRLVNSRDRSWSRDSSDAWYSALVGALTSVALSLPADPQRSLTPKRLAQSLAEETGRRVEAGEILRTQSGTTGKNNIAQSTVKAYSVGTSETADSNGQIEQNTLTHYKR